MLIALFMFLWVLTTGIWKRKVTYILLSIAFLGIYIGAWKFSHHQNEVFLNTELSIPQLLPPTAENLANLPDTIVFSSEFFRVERELFDKEQIKSLLGEHFKHFYLITKARRNQGIDVLSEFERKVSFPSIKGSALQLLLIRTSYTDCEPLYQELDDFLFGKPWPAPNTFPGIPELQQDGLILSTLPYNPEYSRTLGVPLLSTSGWIKERISQQDYQQQYLKFLIESLNQQMLHPNPQVKTRGNP